MNKTITPPLTNIEFRIPVPPPTRTITPHLKIENLQRFQEILEENDSIVIIKFSASWCNPCSKLKPFFDENVKNMPNNIHLYNLDVDENETIYSFLKNKKMINGIPAILAYYKGNQSFIPNDSVRGFNLNELNMFFGRCNKIIKSFT